MREQKDFSDELEQMYKNHHSDVERIESRRCSSDEYDGIQYDIYGYWVSIRPLIDFFADEEGYAIESISYSNDAEPRLCVFVAGLGRSEHPAFTP